MNRLGVIAAGGASSRMGADKAGVEVGGIRMIDRVYEAIWPAVDEVVIAGPPGLVTGVRVVADPVEAVRGPLSALAAAMDVAHEQDAVLLVGVDQPLVRAATIFSLLDLHDDSTAVVPVARERRQVTCAVYPAGWAEEARREATLNQGSLQSLLNRLPCLEVPEVEWRSWGEDGRSWFSVDTPELLAEAERILGTT